MKACENSTASTEVVPPSGSNYGNYGEAPGRLEGIRTWQITMHQITL
jgi:hypothetical protein